VTSIARFSFFFPLRALHNFEPQILDKNTRFSRSQLENCLLLGGFRVQDLHSSDSKMRLQELYVPTLHFAGEALDK